MVFDSTTSQKNSSLHIHEWMIVLFLIGILALLTGVSHSCSSNAIADPEKPAHEVVKTDIEVFIEGFIEQPGKYVVKRGTTLKELLERAKLKPHADLRRLNLQRVLKKGQKIKVAGFKMIQVILNFEDGAKKELEVKKGTKLCDLPEIYSFEEGINLQKLKKKRLLKEGEIIKISLLK